MSVLGEMITEYLEKNGYDGIRNESVGCSCKAAKVATTTCRDLGGCEPTKPKEKTDD